MTVKAIFKGKNSSQGFERNKEYTLTIVKGCTYDIAGSCENPKTGLAYDSIDSFLRNWDNIRRVGK